jgi:ATP-dependent Clp protease, protease subunit
MSESKKKTFDASDAHDTSLLIQSREIFLRSANSQEDEPAINHIVAEKFLINLRILEQSGAEPIIVHQQTVGGDWHSGISIYDAIKNSPCKFILVCHGICASMGSIIAQAPFNKGFRISMPNCEWLIHEGFCAVEGTYKQAFSLYEFEKKILDKSYDILGEAAQKSGRYFINSKEGSAKKFIKKQLSSKEDWWMSPEEALDYGFIDGIFGSEGFESLDQIYKNVL